MVYSRCMVLFLIANIFGSIARADTRQLDVASIIDQDYTLNVQTAHNIWEWAELGYQEQKSSEALQQRLADAGFTVEAGIAAIPTAFVATYGQGRPVIGILAEFDALPGISQSDSPLRDQRPDTSSGHACGHHLFGTASSSAAIAVSQWLDQTNTPGTIKLYGTPAEEGGSGKVYLVRDGQFDDVDIVLHWHPSSRNSANMESNLANRSAKFRFHGISTHAAGAPHLGRSALDGVEAMNSMVNLMREHIPSDARIHYVITSGGSAPNVVPDFAEVFYYVRHPEPTELENIWERVVNTAKGAAMGTGTTMDFEIIHGNRNVLANETLQQLLHANLAKTGGVTYNKEEQLFAETLYTSLLKPSRAIGSQQEIDPFTRSSSFGSTDVGDVSWVVPTGGIRVATWVPGTSSHSWQAIAAGGTTIGYKGMQVAAKVLANTALDIFKDPAIVKKAKAEHENLRGKDFKYTSMLGDREPPLDYRQGVD